MKVALEPVMGFVRMQETRNGTTPLQPHPSVEPMSLNEANYLDVIGHLCIVGLVMLASLVVDEELSRRSPSVCLWSRVNTGETC